VRAAQDRKAVDIVVLDLRKAGGFTDYFVICTGTNPRHLNAIADAVDDTLRAELGERPALAEGVDRSEWILLDYFNFVVHVFSRECRAFYDLERLWGNAERYAVADAVRDTLREALGERPALAEGIDRSEWILLDYFNFVVHIFSRERRAFYGLERLWGNAARYDFSDEKNQSRGGE